MLAALKASAEKLATIHTSTLTKVTFSQNVLGKKTENFRICCNLFVHKIRGKESKDLWNFVVLLYNWSVVNLQVNELVKDLVRYSEELHKKHKQIKVITDHRTIE